MCVCICTLNQQPEMSDKFQLVLLCSHKASVDVGGGGEDPISFVINRAIDRS